MERSTKLESVDEILRAAGLILPTEGDRESAPLAMLAGLRPGAGVRPAQPVASRPAADGTPYPPTLTPPDLLDRILDDGSREEREWRRMSASRAVAAQDPMARSRHARIFRDARGRWFVQNNRSLNGAWMRIDRLAIEGAGQFQMGEQRFLIPLP